MMIGILATWRLASLFTLERGPFAIFEKIRELFGADKPLPETELGKGLACFWCNSIWWAAGIVLAPPILSMEFNLSISDFFITTLAYSTGAIILEEARSWLEQTSIQN